MAERKNYRVKLKSDRDLEVTLKAAQEPASHPGEIVDVSADGVGVRFAAKARPGLAVGSEVDLRFTSTQLKKPLEVQARVRRRHEEEGAVRYGLQFLGEEQTDRKLSPILHALFNRRAAYRVEPDPELPVDVTITSVDGGTTAEGQVVNISAGGLQARLPFESDQAFARVDAVRLSLALPGSPNPCSLVGRISARILSGIVVKYGIAFDPERSENFERQTSAIFDYASKRQREILRPVR